MNSPTPDSLREELERLGESPVDAEELTLAQSGNESPAVAFASALVDFAEPLEFEDLSELERHRAWRAVAERSGHTPASPTGGRGVWALGLVVIAAAAAVAVFFFVPRGTTTDPELELLGTQAHEGLVAIGAVPGHEAERAHAIADDLRRRLEERG